MSDNSILVTASPVGGSIPSLDGGFTLTLQVSGNLTLISYPVGQPPGGRQAPSAAQSRKRSCRPMGTLYLTGLRDRLGQRAPRGIRDRTWSFKMTETL